VRFGAIVAACGVLAGTAGLASAATGPPKPDPSPSAGTSQPATTSSAPSPDRPPSASPAPTPAAPRAIQPQPVYRPRVAAPPVAPARPAKRPAAKKPVVKHAVIKHALVKHAVVKAKTPAPKPHPIAPQARVAPTVVVPLSRSGFSHTYLSIMWVLLVIAAGLALIVFLQRRRAFPILARSRIQRPRQADTDAVAAVAAVTQPQPKVARPRREAEADAVATVAVSRPQPKVARPRPKVEADADAPITQPVRHVVAVSRVARPHRKAEASTDDPVPTRQPRRLVRLPRMHGPPAENEAETDAEAGLYARSYLEWLENN